MSSGGPAFIRSSILILLLLPIAALSAQKDSLEAAGKPTPWEFAVAGYYYLFSVDDDIVMAVGRANHGSLHLESRYNYEDRRTASVFAGMNLSTGTTFTVELTPMAGLAFGRTEGVVPALEMSLGYGSFDFYAEGEYLFDINDKSGNFAYTWLELGMTPMEVLRAGLVAQRMRIFESPLGVDRGIFAQLKAAPGTLSLYAFNLLTDSWFLVIGLEVGW